MILQLVVVCLIILLILKTEYWVSSLLKRKVNSGTEKLLHDSSTDDVGLNGELRSSFHNFTSMSSIDFELLINLLGLKWPRKIQITGGECFLNKRT